MSDSTTKQLGVKAPKIVKAVEPEGDGTGSFPVDLLPDPLAAMAKEISKVSGAPEGITGPVVLATASAAIGAGFEVETKPDRMTRGNLYVLCGIDSGDGKSTAYEPAVKPLAEIEAEILTEWEDEVLPGLLAERDLIEDEIKAIRKPPKKGATVPDHTERRESLTNAQKCLADVEKALLKRPRLIIEEATSEAVGKILAGQKNESIASFSSDAREVAEILLGRYSKSGKSESATSDSIYVKSYSGDSTKVDRAGSTPIPLARPCIALCWLTQPDKLERMLGNRSLTDGGLLPRILVFQSAAEPAYESENEVAMDTTIVSRYEKRIRDIVTRYRMADEILRSKVSAAAKVTFMEYANDCVSKRRRGGKLKDIKSYVARWAENARRIGVVIHAVKHPGDAEEHEVSGDSAAEAIGIMKWFADQQLEILRAGRARVRREKQKEFWNVIAAAAAANSGWVTPKDLYRDRVVRDAADAVEALEMFVVKGWLEPAKITAQGRAEKKPVYRKPEPKSSKRKEPLCLSVPIAQNGSENR